MSLIEVPNGGLSAARNIGLSAATGGIVAYTDADVRVDPDWLTYLVQPFLTSDVAGSGGPNIVPRDDPFVAQCVARVRADRRTCCSTIESPSTCRVQHGFPARSAPRHRRVRSGLSARR